MGVLAMSWNRGTRRNIEIVCAWCGGGGRVDHLHRYWCKEAPQSTQPPHLKMEYGLVGLEVETMAANGSHMTDKGAHSGTSYHTAGSEHVLELKNTAQRSICGRAK